MTLRQVFKVLKYEHTLKPEMFGAGVTGFDEVYPRLVRFIHDMKEMRPGLVDMKGATTVISDRDSNDSLYFASVDIHRCFDNIHQQVLYDLVETIIREDDYLMQQYSVLQRAIRYHDRSFKTHVGASSDLLSFHRVAEILSGKYSNCVFVDGVSCQIVKKKEILELMHEHLFGHSRLFMM